MFAFHVKNALPHLGNVNESWEKVKKRAEREGIPIFLIRGSIITALKKRGINYNSILNALPEELQDMKRSYGKIEQKKLENKDIDYKKRSEEKDIKVEDKTTANLTEEKKEKEKETEYNMAEITRPFTGSPQPTDNTTIGSPSEHKALIDQVNELTKQNNELSAENQNLKSIVIEKNKTIDRLNDTVQKLDTQIQYLKDQNKNMEKVDVNVVRADNNKPQPKQEVKQQQQQTTEQDNDGEFDQEKEKARLEKLLEVKETEFLGYKGAKVGRIALSSDIRDLKDRISMLSRKK